ncbi:hypothetical protein Nazgul40 [Burkholderia phage BcepNazgul]|uniref:Uncharacterized protein n=1 Tax=Burkholderia phage BcepNazgul TaxID=242861 RepID=Q6UYK1_9CAUD|nr:hypothetical protein Nazgul40 [Burkholderia phage BcepNazgul]AAQ63340.1 hypothetical protein Nazgul40 [Burkholderia phage BcepNazgul]
MVKLMTAARFEVTSYRPSTASGSARIPRILNLFARGQRMNATTNNTDQTAHITDKSRIDIKMAITVLVACGSTIGWVANYVGDIRDRARESATQIQFMKEDIKRIDTNQTKVQQDVREDLRRIEDKLDRAINDRNADNASVRKWAK